ncbi:MAG: hypothetical protein K9J06_06865, partial [Flavobacteriales bacterium]|nr:hypothetical protein [Flavobacteriales bacterium]
MRLSTHHSAKVWFATLILLAVGLATAVGQNRHVAISGGVKEARKNLEGVKITLSKDGRTDKSFSTPSSGKFSIPIDVNAQYIIEFYKTGYVTKRISFNTTVPENEQLVWTFDFLVDLFPDVEGLDKAIFVNPVAKIEYSERMREFDYDLDYSMEFQKAEEVIYKQLEQISKDKAEEERKAQKAEADRLAQEAKQRQDAQAQAMAEAKRLEQEKQAAAAAKAAEEARIRNEQQIAATEAAEQEKAAQAKAAEEARIRKEQEIAATKAAEQEKAAQAKAAEETRIRKEQEVVAAKAAEEKAAQAKAAEEVRIRKEQDAAAAKAAAE